MNLRSFLLATVALAWLGGRAGYAGPAARPAVSGPLVTTPAGPATPAPARVRGLSASLVIDQFTHNIDRMPSVTPKPATVLHAALRIENHTDEEITIVYSDPCSFEQQADFVIRDAEGRIVWQRSTFHADDICPMVVVADVIPPRGVRVYPARIVLSPSAPAAGPNLTEGAYSLEAFNLGLRAFGASAPFRVTETF